MFNVPAVIINMADNYEFSKSLKEEGWKKLLSFFEQQPGNNNQEKPRSKHDKLLNNLKTITEKAAKDYFIWTSKKNEGFAKVFHELRIFKSKWFQQFSKIEDLSVNIPSSFCYKLLENPMLDYDYKTQFDFGLEAISELLIFFKNFYIKTKFAFTSVLDDSNFFYLDPVFRILLREKNLMNREIFDTLISFNVDFSQLFSKIDSKSNKSHRSGKRKESGNNQERKLNKQFPGEASDNEQENHEKDEDKELRRERMIQEDQNYRIFLRYLKRDNRKMRSIVFREFSIKKLIRIATERFFPLVNWENNIEEFSGCLTVLKLILNCLKIGLYCAEECESLIDQMLIFCEKMNQFEKSYLEKMSPSNYKESTSLQNSFYVIQRKAYLCRLTSAKILFHILVLFFDEEITKDFFYFRTAKSEVVRGVKNMFTSSAYFKERLFNFHSGKNTSFISKIMKMNITYLMKKNEFAEPEKNKSVRLQLDFFVKLFLMFSGDEKHDFFYDSLRSLKTTSIGYYREIQNFLTIRCSSESYVGETNKEGGDANKTNNRVDGDPKKMNLFEFTEYFDSKFQKIRTLFQDLFFKEEINKKEKDTKKIKDIVFGYYELLASYDNLLTNNRDYNRSSTSVQIGNMDLIRKFNLQTENDSNKKESLLHGEFVRLEFIKNYESRVNEMSNKNNVTPQHKFEYEISDKFQSQLILTGEVRKLLFLMSMFCKLAEHEIYRDEKEHYLSLARAGFHILTLMCKNQTAGVVDLFSLNNIKHVFIITSYFLPDFIFTVDQIIVGKECKKIFLKDEVIERFFFDLFEQKVRSFMAMFQRIAKMEDRSFDEEYCEEVNKMREFMVTIVKFYGKFLQPCKFNDEAIGLYSRKTEDYNLFFDIEKGKINLIFEMRICNLLSKYLYTVYDEILKTDKFENTDTFKNKFVIPKDQKPKADSPYLRPVKAQSLSHLSGNEKPTKEEVARKTRDHALSALKYLSSLFFHSSKNSYDDIFFYNSLAFFSNEDMVKGLFRFDMYINNLNGLYILKHLISIYGSFKAANTKFLRLKDMPQTSQKEITSGNDADTQDQDNTSQSKKGFDDIKSLFELIMDNFSSIRDYFYDNKKDREFKFNYPNPKPDKIEYANVDYYMDVILVLIFSEARKRKNHFSFDHRRKINEFLELADSMVMASFKTNPNDLKDSLEDPDDIQGSSQNIYRNNCYQQIFIELVKSELYVHKTDLHTQNFSENSQKGFLKWYPTFRQKINDSLYSKENEIKQSELKIEENLDTQIENKRNDTKKNLNVTLGGILTGEFIKRDKYSEKLAEINRLNESINNSHVKLRDSRTPIDQFLDVLDRKSNDEELAVSEIRKLVNTLEKEKKETLYIKYDSKDINTINENDLYNTVCERIATKITQDLNYGEGEATGKKEIASQEQAKRLLEAYNIADPTGIKKKLEEIKEDSQNRTELINSLKSYADNKKTDWRLEDLDLLKNKLKSLQDQERDVRVGGVIENDYQAKTYIGIRQLKYRIQKILAKLSEILPIEDTLDKGNEFYMSNIILKVIDYFSQSKEHIRKLTIMRHLSGRDIEKANAIIDKSVMSPSDRATLDSQSNNSKIFEDQKYRCYAKKYRTQAGNHLVAYEKTASGENGKKLSKYEIWCNGSPLKQSYIWDYKNWKFWLLNEKAEQQIYQQVIETYDKEEKPLETLIDSLIDELCKIKIRRESDDKIFNFYKNHFFMNPSFFSVLGIFNKVLQSFVETNKEDSMLLDKFKTDKGSQAFLLIWRMYKGILRFVNSREIMINEYFLYYKKCKEVIYFLKNLCENDNYEMKKFFANESENSILERISNKDDYNFHDLTSEEPFTELVYNDYDLLVKKHHLTKLNKGTVSEHDSFSHFYFYDAVLYMLIELINGGRIQPKWILDIKYHTKIWINIVYQMENDPNHLFYIFKKNVIIFLLAFIECQDAELINMVGNNLSFEKLLKTLTRSIAKMYVFCKKKNAQRNPLTQKEMNKKEQYELTQNKYELCSYDMNDLEEEKYLVSPNSESEHHPNRELIDPATLIDQLFQMYFCNNRDFSDHILIDICVNIFILIQLVSLEVRSYSIEIKNLNSQISKSIYDTFSEFNGSHVLKLYYLKFLQKCFNKKVFKKTSFGISKNDVAIWYFMTKITDSVEIVKQTATQPEEKEEANEENKTAEDSDQGEGKDEETTIIIPYFFKLHPEIFLYTSNLKDDFFQNADYGESSEEKEEQQRASRLKYFFDDIDGTIVEITAQRKIYRASLTLFSITKQGFWLFLRWILFILSCIINVFMILSLQNKVQDNNHTDQDFNDSKNGNFTQAILALSITGICIAGIGLFTYFIYVLTFAYIFIKKKFATYKHHSKLSLFFSFCWKCFDSMFYAYATDFWSFILVIVSHSVAISVTYFCYILPLFLLLGLFPLLNSIIKAIAMNIHKLLYLLLIIASLTNCFAIIALQFFNSSFSADDEPIVGFCDNFQNCLLNVFNQGMQAGGGIADLMTEVKDLNNSKYFGLFFFVNIYWTLVQTLLLSAFFGIVVDTFKSYKANLLAKDSNIKDMCYICGLKREDFEKHNLDFEKHQTEEHSVFSYFNLLYALKKKNEVDYDGTEIYISGMLGTEKRNEFFPNKHCLEFQRRNYKSAD
jgi:hypothetical protein